MNLDLWNITEINKNDWIESKIYSLMNEIKKEFKFKWNTLEQLFNFKLSKNKIEVIESSNNFRNALIAEIEKMSNSWDIVLNNDAKLTWIKYETLANKIIEINELSKEIKAWIQELRAELLNETSLSSNSLLTKWFYSKNLLQKIDNPKNFKDELIWLWVASIEVIAVVLKFWYDIWRDFILFPYHIIQILKWEVKYNWIKI